MGKKKAKLSEIPCIYCGGKISIEPDFNQNTVLNCPHCGESFSISLILKESKDRMEELDKKNDLGRVFDKAKKRMDSI